MLFDITRLSKDEQITLRLGELFENYGYRRFRMSKFEEYSFYLENKNFLKTEQIIPFSDSNGKLLALKPDITLSIAKTSLSTAKNTEKVYYIESIYRYAKHSKEYKEVPQIGLEIMGEVDGYKTSEVLSLAVSALRMISDNFILDLSHAGLLPLILEECGVNIQDTEKFSALLVDKNGHDLEMLAKRVGLNADNTKKLKTLINLPSDFMAAIKALDSFGDKISGILNELRVLGEYLIASCGGKIRFDLSIVTDTAYYNGIVFQGFVDKIPFMVLSGGRYDLLLQKFGKDASAIGFALNLDGIARYYPPENDAKRELLIVYTERTPITMLQQAIDDAISKGYSVTADKKKLSGFSEVIEL